MSHPRAFAWFNLVSKFHLNVRNSWSGVGKPGAKENVSSKPEMEESKGKSKAPKKQ